MEKSTEIVPPTAEGISIHLSYIRNDLAELNKKMDSVAQNTVSRQEWADHIKRDDDHEARIRANATAVNAQTTEISNIKTQIKTWGIALGVFFTVMQVIIQVALSYVK